MIRYNDYLERITAWLPYARHFFYTPPDRPDLLCYGTGYDGWGVQTNQKAFSAFAISGSLTGDDDAVGEALRLLRFCLETHIEGSYSCTDGRKWGHTWISALGTERMMHAVEAVRPHLSAGDEELLRRVLLSEARWLLNDYEVVAGLENSSGRNKPESNLWNGSLLYRAALLYPDSPDAAACAEKAFQFFVNSISIPEDEESSRSYDGKSIAPHFKGANFFPSFALNHHGYLNVGYMVICLSQIAMLHLWCRERKFPVPEALYHHADDLWRLVKTFTFPDGRLMRIGGDTRARYCYCQDYLIPTWLFILDRYQDEDVLSLEEGWLAQVETEQENDGDGGFISERGSELRDISQLYYTRLDSDRACSLSMGAWWRKRPEAMDTAAEKAGPGRYPRFQIWSDEYHGSFFHEDKDLTCSFTWEAAEGPTALYLPSRASNLAEWRHNLTVHARGEGSVQSYHIERKALSVYSGGAVTSGCYEICESIFLAESEAGDKVVAHVNLLYALLPDSCTAVLIQHAVSPYRTPFRELRGLFFQVPNDIWNGKSRTYTWRDGSRTISGFGSSEEAVPVDSEWIEIDGSIRVERIYGPGEFTMYRPGRRQIGFKRSKSRSHIYSQGMLYCDEICGEFLNEKRFFHRGETIVDSAYVLTPTSAGSHRSVAGESSVDCGASACRAVISRAGNGKRYLAVLPLEGAREASLWVGGGVHGTARDVVSGDSCDIRDGRIDLAALNTGKIFELMID